MRSIALAALALLSCTATVQVRAEECRARADVLYCRDGADCSVHAGEIDRLASWADRADAVWRDTRTEQHRTVSSCLRHLVWVIRPMEENWGWTTCSALGCEVHLEPHVLEVLDHEWVIPHELTHVAAYCGLESIDADHSDTELWRRYGAETYMARVMKEPPIDCR